MHSQALLALALSAGLALGVGCGPGETPSGDGADVDRNASSQVTIRDDDASATDQQPTAPDPATLTDAELAQAVAVWEPAFGKLFGITERLREQNYWPASRQSLPREGARGTQLAAQLGMSDNYFSFGMGTLKPDHFELRTFATTVSFTLAVNVPELGERFGDEAAEVVFQAQGTDFRWVHVPPVLAEAMQRAERSRNRAWDWIKVAEARDALQRSSLAIQAYLDRRGPSRPADLAAGPMTNVWQRTGTQHIPRGLKYFEPHQFRLASFDPMTHAFRVSLQSGDATSNPSMMQRLDHVVPASWWPHDTTHARTQAGESTHNGTGADPTDTAAQPPRHPRDPAEPGAEPLDLPRPLLWVEIEGALVENDNWPADVALDTDVIASAIRESLNEAGYRLAASRDEANVILSGRTEVNMIGNPHTFLEELVVVQIQPTLEMSYHDRRRQSNPERSHDYGQAFRLRAWGDLSKRVAEILVERNVPFVLSRIPLEG